VGWIRGKMLSNKKNVFWEALVIVIAIFLVGFFLGLLVEEASTNEASELLLDSEVKLVDAMALTFLSEKSEISCE
jgi:NhaP-type Na+/H+ or K+/H+ antiporter